VFNLADHVEVMAASMGHEINQPFTGIVMGAARAVRLAEHW
jgi:C4-dicarboxylate-specific signal transduction histidine kinase